MSDLLVDKVAIVTGGGGGIGREAVKVFVENGARVVVADISESAGRETLEYVGAGADVEFVAVDVADLESCGALVRSTVEKFGRLDVAFNNAGVELNGVDLADITPDQFDRITRVNYTGMFFALKAEIPQMIQQGGGSIVNTASGLGVVALPEQSAYIASKHGVIGLTKAAALDYAKRGIRVNAILPGVVETPMIEAVEQKLPGFKKMVEAKHPIGRLAQPREIANAALWLASDLSTNVTGASISVDGGFVAQ